MPSLEVDRDDLGMATSHSLPHMTHPLENLGAYFTIKTYYPFMSRRSKPLVNEAPDGFLLKMTPGAVNDTHALDEVHQLHLSRQHHLFSKYPCLQWITTRALGHGLSLLSRLVSLVGVPDQAGRSTRLATTASYRRNSSIFQCRHAPGVASKALGCTASWRIRRKFSPLPSALIGRPEAPPSLFR
jgi:hypothetical protein